MHLYAVVPDQPDTDVGEVNQVQSLRRLATSLTQEAGFSRVFDDLGEKAWGGEILQAAPEAIATARYELAQIAAPAWRLVSTTGAVLRSDAVLSGVRAVSTYDGVTLWCSQERGYLLGPYGGEDVPDRGRAEQVFGGLRITEEQVGVGVAFAPMLDALEEAVRQAAARSSEVRWRTSGSDGPWEGPLSPPCVSHG